MYVAETIPSAAIGEHFEDCCSRLGGGGVLLVADHDVPKAVMMSPADYEEYSVSLKLPCTGWCRESCIKPGKPVRQGRDQGL